MATKRRKSTGTDEELTKALNEIINQNLTIGISTLGDDTSDFNDDHADMKSNASNNWRRGSVSYSQPSSPKGNPSLSPVSSVSSLSDLSTENYESNGSESCASLNSNDSFHSQLMHEFITEEIIHEHKQDIIDIPPIPTENNNRAKNMQTISKNTLKIPNKNKKRKKKKKKNGLTKSTSYDHQQTLKLKPITNTKPKKRRNSKDCLDITIIKKLTNKSIELWSINDVFHWIKYIDNGKHGQYANNFKIKRIDGKKLFKMNRIMLQSIEIYHPSARKAILAALQKLKKKVRQTSKKQINLYSKTHNYEKKKLKRKQRKHQRGISNFETNKLHNKLHKLTGIKSEMYVVAIKKRPPSSVACMTDHFSAPGHINNRKYSANISEFLNEWDIDKRHNEINFLGSNILEQTDNFTMIELANKKIVYAVTARVEKWTNNDVCKWLNSISNGKFKKFIETFKERNTNGFDLLNISRVQLQNKIEMKDANMRNILLREIKLLKIATKPKNKLLKKRTSAISVKEMQIAKHKELVRGKGKHRKSASLLTGMGRSHSHSELYTPPKKLGPRDIGRNKGYKGTKWERKLFEYDFLEEKLNYQAKAQYFNKRKMKNPVQHKETVDEIGIVKDFHKPEYTNDVLRNINRDGWLKDKPISRRNIFLDSLKGTKAPKNSLICDINSPVGWKPIKYECVNDGKNFLEEHFWFDGSGVKFEFSFSRLLKCLPANKLLKLNTTPSPTGYESKLNWLKMLLNLVTDEMKLIQKEDSLYQQTNINNNNIIPNDNIVIPKDNIVIPKDNDNKSDIETVNISDVETVDIKSDENIINSDDNNNENISLPESILSDSDSNDSNILSPNNLLSPDMNTKRSMYKTHRNRANTNATTLANSTLSGVTPKMGNRKRTLSIQDINRRRFLSQDSVNSIQAIILNIEKKRAQGNKIEQIMD